MLDVTTKQPVPPGISDVVVKRTKPHRKWTRYSTLTFYLFVLPWILGFLVLMVMPLLYALLMSFSNFDGISVWRWIGLKNYFDVFRTGEVWYSLRQTILYTIINVPLGVGGGLGLALLINRNMRGIGFFRTIYYLPAIVPVVASAVMWRIVFDRDTGILNAVIEKLGGPTIAWLTEPYVFWGLIIMVLWGMGGGMIVSLAGLQGIPQELREAASIDGANAWQSFRSVTLPLLTPVLFFEIVTGMIGSFQTLIQPLLLVPVGGGGSAAAYAIPHSNNLYMVYVYQQFFYFQRFGYGAALLWVLFIAILLATLLLFRSSPFWVHYEVEKENAS